MEVSHGGTGTWTASCGINVAEFYFFFLGEKNNGLVCSNQAE